MRIHEQAGKRYKDTREWEVFYYGPDPGAEWNNLERLKQLGEIVTEPTVGFSIYKYREHPIRLDETHHLRTLYKLILCRCLEIWDRADVDTLLRASAGTPQLRQRISGFLGAHNEKAMPANVNGATFLRRDSDGKWAVSDAVGFDDMLQQLNRKRLPASGMKAAKEIAHRRKV